MEEHTPARNGVTLQSTGREQDHKRLVAVDNAKAVLISLVVFGHLVNPGQERLAGAIQIFVYVFHIPAFVFLAGMFSKVEIKRADCRSLVSRLLIPLMVFQLGYFLCFAIGKPNAGFQLLEPFWILWFLLSLLFWRLMLPLFAILRMPLTMAVGISLLAGYSGSIGVVFSFSRTLVFFPFFLAGHRFGHGLYQIESRRRVRIASILWLGLILSICPFFRPGVTLPWLWGNNSYAACGVIGWWVGSVRLTQLVVSGITLVAVLLIFPQGPHAFTFLGQRSMQIYVLQAPVINILSVLHLLPRPGNLSIVAALVMTPLIVVFLGSGLVEQLWQSAMSDLEKLLTRPRAETPM